MSGLELNKIVASVLLASLVAMLVGFFTNKIYKPQLVVAERGYKVEVEEETVDTVEEKPLDIEALMANANAESGGKVFKKCISCHSIENNGAHKVGPNLWNIIDKKKGSKAGYSYSSAMTNSSGNWNIDNLFAFLKKPSKYIVGTKMSFAGLRKPEDIANVITYMKKYTE